jgi:hypothetical protein
VNLGAQLTASELSVSPFRKTTVELRKLTAQFPFMGFRREFADQLFYFLGILIHTLIAKDDKGDPR